MVETLSHLALEGWYDDDCAKCFNLLSATNKWRSTRRAHLLRLQTILEQPIIRPVSQQVNHLRETHVRGVCRSIKLTSLRDSSEHFGTPIFGQLLHANIEEDWRPDNCGLVLGYGQNVLIERIFITLQNGLLYYCQLFHNPTSVEYLGLDCKVEYTIANKWIMPEAYNILLQYAQSAENTLGNPVHGQISSCTVLFFNWTLLNQILQYPERLLASKAILTYSKGCKKTQQWVLHCQAQEYAVVIPTKFKDLHDWADCVDRFIWVVKQTNRMHIVPIGAIDGPAHLVQENNAWGGIDSIWHVINHVDLDIYWTEYQLD
jgi:hypothetical protein